MKIILDTQDEIFAKDFIPNVLKEFIEKHFSESKSIKLGTFLRQRNITHSVKDILLYAIETLKKSKEGNEYHLEIDKNIMMPRTPHNVETLVKLITYGTADIKGYDILVKAFDYVTLKLKTLKKIYIARNKKKGE